MFASFEVCSPASIRTFKALTATKATGSPKMSSMLRPCDCARTLPLSSVADEFSPALDPLGKRASRGEFCPVFHVFMPRLTVSCQRRLQRLRSVCSVKIKQ